VAHHLEAGQRVHQELPLSDAGDALLTEPSDAGHLLLAFHVDDAGEIAAVGVPLNSDEFSDVD
jgi:hypothetical protein